MQMGFVIIIAQAHYLWPSNNLLQRGWTYKYWGVMLDFQSVSLAIQLNFIL